MLCITIIVALGFASLNPHVRAAADVGGVTIDRNAGSFDPLTSALTPATLEYVEGLNDDQSIMLGPTYGADWFGIEYTPTASYDLKKVELMAGGDTGEYIIQLRLDSAGWPSIIVQREANFTMVNTVSWQGAEFATSYSLTAGTVYWIVFKPVFGSQASVATSGTAVTHVFDYDSDGWDGKTTTSYWMAKFYKESTEFQHHVRVSPFTDVLHLNATGSVIYGVDDATSYSNQPVLGTFSGDNFYICIDFTKDDNGDPIYYEMALIVGHISTRSGDLYQTTDGKSLVGPTPVTLVSVASPETPTEEPNLASAPTVEPEPKGWPPTYHVNISPFTDVLHMHVDGPVIHGIDNATGFYYNQPVLGTHSGDNFYIFVDGLKVGPIELIMIVGTVSTRSGNLYSTTDGKSWMGPTAVTLVSV